MNLMRKTKEKRKKKGIEDDWEAELGETPESAQPAPGEPVFDLSAKAAVEGNLDDEFALPGLMTSGDLEIHADEFFTAGATSVQITAKRTDNGAMLPARTLQQGDGFIVMTVPNVPVEIGASATVGNTTLVAVSQAHTLKPGEDRRIDLIVAGLELTLSRTSVPADGAATATVRAGPRRTAGRCPRGRGPAAPAPA